MTSFPFRKTTILAATALSTAALALFCGAVNAEPAQAWRIAQADPAQPPLTEEQKLKLEEIKKRRQQQQPGGEPPQGSPPAGDAPPRDRSRPPATDPKPQPPPPAPPKVETPPPPAPPKPPVTDVKPQPPVAPKVETPPPPPVTPKVETPPAPPKPPVTDVKPPVLAPVTPKAETPPPAAPPVKIVNPPPAPQNGAPPTGAAPDAGRQHPPRDAAAPPQAPVVGGQPSPIPHPAPPFVPRPSTAGRGIGIGQPPGIPGRAFVPPVKNLEEAKTGRTEKVEAGGNRTVIKEIDRRTIVRQGDRVVIQKDEAAQLQRVAPGAVFTRGKLGSNVGVVERPNNTQIVTETDRSGQLIRRFRRDGEGHETAIIDNRRRKKDHFGRDLAIGLGVGAGIIAGAAILNSVVDVPPPVVNVPREKYVVRYESADEDDVYEALSAPPMERMDRHYTLDQVRATPHLRDRMRRIDLDDINFETGSWDVDPSEYRKLERVAHAMKRVIARNPNEVFLIEGYTDAVGSDVDNLTLSDRRAESVSVVLSEQFDVPFENLTTQGYGEQYLKVEIDGPERANRRVAVRRITPLISDVREPVYREPPPRPRVEERNYDDEDAARERWRRRNWRRHHSRDYDHY